MKHKKHKGGNIWLQRYKEIYGEDILKNVLFIQRYWRDYLKQRILFTKSKIKDIEGDWRCIRNIDIVDNWSNEINRDINLLNYTIRFGNETNKILYQELNFHDINLKKYYDILSCTDKKELKEELLYLRNSYYNSVHSVEQIKHIAIKNKIRMKDFKSYIDNISIFRNRLSFNHNIFINNTLNNMGLPYNYNIYNKDFMYKKTGKYYIVNHGSYGYAKELRYLMIRVKKNNLLLERYEKKLYLSQLKNISDDILELINNYLVVDDKFIDKNVLKIQRAWNDNFVNINKHSRRRKLRFISFK